MSRQYYTNSKDLHSQDAGEISGVQRSNLQLLYLLLKLNMLCILCSSGSNLAEACFQGSLVTCHEKQLEFIRTLKLASKLQSQAPLLPYSTRDC